MYRTACRCRTFASQCKFATVSLRRATAAKQLSALSSDQLGAAHSRLSAARVVSWRPSLRQNAALSTSRSILRAGPDRQGATMEVTRHNFAEMLPEVKAALAGCHFYALDCEMTGLHVRDGSRTGFFEDIQDRYEQMVESAQNFLITQFGLSTFAWEEGQYVARTFNFYVFPRPADGFDKRFLCQAGSMDFLAGQGFDFNRWVRDGISYMPVALRDAKLAALRRQNGGEGAGFGSVNVTKPEEREFVAQLGRQVQDWLKGTEDSLQLEGVNSYFRRLQYQHLSSLGPSQESGFVVERLQGNRNNATLQLRRVSPQQAAQWIADKADSQEAGIHDAAGFAAVFEAMRDSGKPAVGHNLALDLAFSLESFAGSLPLGWREYKALAAVWFPGGIYDTKRLAQQLETVFQGQTSLSEVYGITSGAAVEMRNPAGLEPSLAAAGVAPEALPQIEHAPGFVRYEGDEAGKFAHEAGYDAFMTGASFAGLLALLRMRDAAGGLTAAAAAGRPDIAAASAFLGQLNLVRSDIPYAALSGPDPLPDRRHVFHVAGLPAGSRHTDISTAFAQAGLGRVFSVMLDSDGTSAAVSMMDVESATRIAAALSGWGPVVTPYAEWAKARRATDAAETVASAVAAAAVAARPTAGDGHGRVKRRRILPPAAAVEATPPASLQPPPQRPCSIQ